MQARLIFRRLTKRYGPATALDALSFEVETGEIFGFLGPNGAGKSTAISLAMGLLRPTEGGGELLGLPFAHARRARAQVGYVPDNPVFFRGTALDTLTFAAQLNQADAPERTSSLRGRCLALLEQLDLPTHGKQARNFSRGMQQKLALAQALITRPALLILDEPTSALDPVALKLVHAALKAARDEGASVFLSSHQLSAVEELCDRIGFLKGGRLRHLGRLEDLLPEGQTARITMRGVTELFLARAASAFSAQVSASQERSGDVVFALSVSAQQRFLEHAWSTGAELVRVERDRQTLAGLFDRHLDASGGLQEAPRRKELP